MKLEMNPTNRLVAAAVAVALLAVAFWMMLLSPKREEEKKLGAQVERLEASLAQHEAEVAQGEEAREEFPADYQHLVVLGKAVPGDDDVASLLVQLNRLANGADGTFSNLELAESATPEETTTAPAEGVGGEPASATEVAASLLPLGASVGPAGLAVMPYEVSFEGKFTHVADFIAGIDSLVNTNDEGVVVDGRLVTIDGFTLEADELLGFPYLNANFSLTTYLTPPGEGVTGGASPTAPPTATPAATTIGATP
jgi:Tfp pilus assembly protein PilO